MNTLNHDVRTVLTLIFILVLIWISYIFLKTRIFYQNSQSLFTISAQFEHDYYVGNKKLPLTTYLAIGDSTAVGTGVYQKEQSYPYLIAQHLASQGHFIHVINTAKSGARLKDLVTSQLSILKTVKPNVISITIGANDATHFTSLSSYENSLTVLKDSLPQKAQILFATTPYMRLSPALPYPYDIAVGLRCQQENEILLKVFSTSHSKIINLYDEGRLDRSELYATDMFHPGSSGYARWADLFIHHLN